MQGSWTVMKGGQAGQPDSCKRVTSRIVGNWKGRAVGQL
jgi:hypothetical protein